MLNHEEERERKSSGENVIALAKGLLELGIPVFSNCNYWHQNS